MKQEYLDITDPKEPQEPEIYEMIEDLAEYELNSLTNGEIQVILKQHLIDKWNNYDNGFIEAMYYTTYMGK
jgi:hypothetical protein